MTIPLPSSGSEREILLRGLRAYSDNCEPPYLTPGCPFAVDLRDGTRGCGEECIDLIAELGVPPGVEEWELRGGTGLRVQRRRRPRTRRGPDKRTRPFDAAEIYLEDAAEREMELWSPVSLLYELRQTLGSPPPEDDAEAKERAGSIVRLTAILEERGIGFERFLRPSFAGGQGILIGVIAVLAPRIAEDDVPSRLVEIGTRWRSILGIGDAEGTQTADEKEIADARLITSNVERTVTWAMSASLDELIEWWPSRGRIPEVDHQALSRMSQSDQWITDRFLATYLDHWSTEALHAEWDWIHGRRESPIPVATMRARKVDPVQLATQIADVAVEERADRSNPVAMGQYQSLAGRLLEEGRREAAVGVFEGVLTVEPHDPEAHNNRGFCLIPDDPAAAIPSLERAAELGYEPAAINAANRALALLQLGRLAAANELAETWFDRTSDRDPIAGMMWDPASVGSEPTLMPVRDTALYFAKIGREIANRASDEALQSCWASRIAIRAIATDDSAGE